MRILKTARRFAFYLNFFCFGLSFVLCVNASQKDILVWTKRPEVCTLWIQTEICLCANEFTQPQAEVNIKLSLVRDMDGYGVCSGLFLPPPLLLFRMSNSAKQSCYSIICSRSDTILQILWPSNCFVDQMMASL